MNPSIVIAAYSRPRALARLLRSIEVAKYPADNIKVIISIDGGAVPEVVSIAKQYVFSHGDVTVLTRENNLGLRNHILWCGEQSQTYGSVIVLEDDLIVDPHFFYYAKAALENYDSHDRIAGIALYSPKFNEYANLPFEPLKQSNTNYFMQVPCSWGQAWTKRQWSNFKEWYENSTSEDVRHCKKLPSAVKGWSEKSWKKFFAAYMVEKDIFFSYSYLSYSTNCGDAGGVHLPYHSSTLQVPMASRTRTLENFEFVQFGDSIKYDAFMERIDPEGVDKLGLSLEDVELDFYGIKPLAVLREKKYSITSKKTAKVEKAIPMGFKPLELNLLGEDISCENSVFVLSRSENVRRNTFYWDLYRHYRIAMFQLSVSSNLRRFLSVGIFNMSDMLQKILVRISLPKK